MNKNTKPSKALVKTDVSTRFYLHIGANGTFIFKNKKKKDNPYYTATHILYLKPIEKGRISQELKIGKVCNDVDGNIYKIISFKECS